MKRYLVTCSAKALHHEFIEHDYIISSYSGSYYAMTFAVTTFKKDILDQKFGEDWEILDVRIREIIEDVWDCTEIG